jgi:hypothetical protein
MTTNYRLFAFDSFDEHLSKKEMFQNLVGF